MLLCLQAVGRDMEGRLCGIRVLPPALASFCQMEARWAVCNAASWTINRVHCMLVLTIAFLRRGYRVCNASRSAIALVVDIFNMVLHLHFPLEVHFMKAQANTRCHMPSGQ